MHFFKGNRFGFLEYDARVCVILISITYYRTVFKQIICHKFYDNLSLELFEDVIWISLDF